MLILLILIPFVMVLLPKASGPRVQVARGLTCNFGHSSNSMRGIQIKTEHPL